MIAKRLCLAIADCLTMLGTSQYSQAGKPGRPDTAYSSPAAVYDKHVATNTSRPVAPAGDHRFHVMDPLADLEGYAEFEADYHSLGLWYNHRLGVEIRNVDRNYSGPLRTYESARSRAVSWG